jgi:MFS transporter, SP family, sugar:H+ symporter
MLMIGALVQSAAMFTMGGLGLRDPVPASYKPGIIVAFIFYSMGFAFGWAPLTYVVTTELPALRLRDRNQRVASLVNIFMNFLVNFTVPYLLSPPYANLQSKVGFIFGSITLLSCVFIYFCVPECKGRTLEEIDTMFNEKVPVRQFGTYPSFAMHGSDEEGVVEKGAAGVVEVREKAGSSMATDQEKRLSSQASASPVVEKC